MARGSVPGLGQRERRRAVRRALAPPARRSRRTCYPLLLPLARSSCPLVCVVASFLLSCIAPRGHVGGTCRSTITHTLMRALSASRFRACAHAHEQRIRSDIAASLMCAEHAFAFFFRRPANELTGGILDAIDPSLRSAAGRRICFVPSFGTGGRGSSEEAHPEVEPRGAQNSGSRPEV